MIPESSQTTGHHMQPSQAYGGMSFGSRCLPSGACWDGDVKRLGSAFNTRVIATSQQPASLFNAMCAG